MQKITLLLVLCALCLSGQLINAQDTIPNVNTLKIESLKKSKIEVEEEEKSLLKKDVEAINEQVANGTITESEAEALKQEAAQKRALNIENRVAIIDNKIELLERNEEGYNEGEEKKKKQIEIIISDDDSADGFLGIITKDEDKPKKYDKRTSSHLVFAMGFNNAIIEGEKLDDSPYKLGGSSFIELGYAWKTRLLNNSNFLRLKYGFSFQWNKLNIKDNQYLVNNDGVISLEPFPNDACVIKFRMTNIVFPVHLEFGPSRRIDRSSYYRYSTKKQLKFGVGFYGGFNIQTMQKLKYTDVNGNKAKDKLKGGYNTSNLIYGPSAYVALGCAALYFKYDLNPIFKDQAVSQNNISLGLRFDMN
ncbi:hypothetical protein [Algibacter mikhailovii]|uniref:Outer membrane protein beta-barrel domain-containing protein n=1 Tax=Algibacter mikhailovii TaxID=425498 RepID=A0A918V5H4_9FLAO|nr:hypothetical protein [Algibacter mikhailovii]GGZ72952.1 hypothetical protein GCM10007028_07510 [Algibacter mikhailovii]